MLASAAIYSIRDARASGSRSAESPAAPVRAQPLHLDLFFAILTGKVYTLGLLRTLNSRTQFRAGMHTSHLGRRSLTGWDFATADAGARARGPGGGGGGSWAGSGVGPGRGTCASGAVGAGQAPRREGEDRQGGRDGACSLEETAGVPEMDCDRLSIQVRCGFVRAYAGVLTLCAVVSVYPVRTLHGAQSAQVVFAQPGTHRAPA